MIILRPDRKDVDKPNPMEHDIGMFEVSKTLKLALNSIPHRRGCGFQNDYYGITADVLSLHA